MVGYLYLLIRLWFLIDWSRKFVDLLVIPHGFGFLNSSFPKIWALFGGLYHVYVDLHVTL